MLAKFGWFLVFVFNLVGFSLLYIDPYFIQRLSH